MKNLLPILAMLMLATSCISAQEGVRERGLFPAADLAWGSQTYGVHSDVLRGLADAVVDGDLIDETIFVMTMEQVTAALDDRDLEGLRLTAWNTLSPFALRGIEDRVEDGEMVEAAAVFLVRRLGKWEIAMQTLVDPLPTMVMPTGRAPQPLEVEIR